MTRHDLKDQVQHDNFTDIFSGALNYSVSHRQQLIKWAVAGLAIVLLVGAGFWYSSYRTAQRQQDLQAAFDVFETPVGPAAAPGAKSFPDETTRRKAAVQSFGDVVSKDGGSREGLIAQYYRGTLSAAQQDQKTAESDLRTVSDSSSQYSVLAKIALSQLYAGQNKVSDARSLLTNVVNKPTPLVSKAQADILLAQLERASNPQGAQKILQSLRTPNQDPAVSRAVEQLSTQSAK